MVGLSKLLFQNKEGKETRESWLSYVNTIAPNVSAKLHKLLPESLISTDIDNDVKPLRDERTILVDKIDVACIDISIVILYFYNNEYAKGEKLLVETNKWIANELHSKISFENLIYWIGFLFNCYIAIIFDCLAYVVKVFIHPASWFSSSKRDKILNTCNSYRMLVKSHSDKKSEEKELNSLNSQIDTCITICREMSKQ